MAKLVKTGFNNATGFTKLGFLLEDLEPSQIAYLCCHACNEWLQKSFGVCPSIFYINNSVPCVPSFFPHFHVRNVASYDGSIISTSVYTAIESLNACRAAKYFYINELEWTRSWFQHKDQLDNILNNDTIVKFTRCKDYYDLLTKQGYKIHKTIVPDFDIGKILEIVHETK